MSHFSFNRLMGIYLPPEKEYSDKSVIHLKTTENQSVCVRTFEPFSAQNDNYNSVVLFSHGNADNIATCASYCQWLSDELQVPLVCYDYIGYGLSGPGNCSEDNMHKSILCVHDWIQNHKKYKNIFVLGKSLGSVPSVWLASRKSNIAGLILVSPIASGARVLINAQYIPKTIRSGCDSIMFDNIANIEKVRTETLFIHGTQDSIVPKRNTEDLMRHMSSECNAEHMFVRAGHNDIEIKHTDYFLNTLSAFLHRCTCLPEQQNQSNVYMTETN